MRNILLFLLLFVSFSFAEAQTTVTIYKQPPSNNGYPITALAGSERREYVDTWFNYNNVVNASWTTNASSVLTLTTPNSFAAGDIVEFDNVVIDVSGNSHLRMNPCRVTAADANSITINAVNCSSTSIPASSSGVITGPMWATSGNSYNPNGTWEVYTTVGSETFYLMSKNKARFAGGIGCNQALAVAHDPSCYTAHPALAHELSGPGVYIEVGPTKGSCSYTGAIATSNLELHSTIEFDVKFTSDQDPSVSHIQHYLVCANGAGTGKDGYVQVNPGYAQIYKGGRLPLFGSVFGSAVQQLTWSIASTDHLDGVADATIDFPTSMDPVFVAGNTGGGYVVKACTPSDATACENLRIWVATAQAKPAANVDQVIQVPCEVDPVMTAYGGEDFEVGPGQTYSDLQSIPFNTGQWHYGATVRIHNEGSTVGNPLTIHNFLGIDPPANPNGPGDGSVPYFHVCGIPNPTSGELPIMDGDHATGASWLTPYGQIGSSLIGAFGSDTGNNNVYQAVDMLARGSLISGIRFQNANPSFQFYRIDGTLGTYLDAASVRVYGQQHTAVIGTRSVQVANPYFVDCNVQTQGWKNCALDSYWLGNHSEGYGISGRPTEHSFYDQAIRSYVIGNFEEGSVQGNAGATGCYSFRSSRAIFAYNYCVPKSPSNTGSGPGGNSEIQDAYTYYESDAGFGPQGYTTCSLGDTNAPFCPTPDNVTGGVNAWAAFEEEHFHSFFNFANITYMASGDTFTGIAQTHPLVTERIGGNAYVYYNTNRRPSGSVLIALFEDIRPSFPSDPNAPYQPVRWPAAEFQNNDIWNVSNVGCSYGSCSKHNRTAAWGMINFTTNVVHTGQFSPTQTGIPILLGNADGVFPYGLSQSHQFTSYTADAPVEGHIGGWSTNNFVPSSTDTVSTTNFITYAAAINNGAASDLVWPMSWYPPRFNAVNPASGMTLVPRANMTAVGASDPAGGPTLASIAISPPGPLTLRYPSTADFTATCMLSDGTSQSCTNNVTWSNGGSSSFTVDSSGHVSTLLHGSSGALTATMSSITSSPVTITVTTPKVILGNGVKVGVGSGNGISIF